MILDFIFTLSIYILATIFWLSIGFIAFMLIQGITYWATGFSIYNYLKRKFIVEQLSK